VTLGVEVPGEEVAYLSGAAGDDDLHDGVCFSWLRPTPSSS
jgi:hypothetical protein